MKQPIAGVPVSCCEIEQGFYFNVKRSLSELYLKVFCFVFCCPQELLMQLAVT